MSWFIWTIGYAIVAVITMIVAYAKLDDGASPETNWIYAAFFGLLWPVLLFILGIMAYQDRNLERVRR